MRSRWLEGTPLSALWTGVIGLVGVLAGCQVDPPRPQDNGRDEASSRVDAGLDSSTRTRSDVSVASDVVTTEDTTSRRRSTDSDASRFDSGRAPTTDTSDSTGGPPYPIVLAHGFSGFEHLTDLEALPYYYNVEKALEAEGETVFVSEVDPFNDSYERGRELVGEVEQFLSTVDADKVHVIGHSQGGLDARYVAHERPDMVASVVTIATPHEGTQLSDIALGFIAHPMFQQTVDAMTRLFGRAIYDEAGETSSAVAALKQFSDDGIEEFNRKITDQPGVFYASIAGRTDQHLGWTECRPSNAPPFIEKWEHDGDTTGALFQLTESVLNGPAYPGFPNDGLVRVSHAKWGRFLGCIPADHLDQVGQIAGDPPGPLNDWDHIDFFKHLVDWLHRREQSN
jgi:triacylglycerol lipase